MAKTVKKAKTVKTVMAKAKTAKVVKTAKADGGIMKKMKASTALQAIVKTAEISRGEMMKAIWVYIKKNNLQDAKDKRTINPDEKLAAVLGKKAINMFKMTAKLSEHLS